MDEAMRYLRSKWETVTLGLLSVLTLLPIAPSFHQVPTTDSSVFIYIGSQILRGRIPYLEVWDHKGPLIYYINALGLWLSGSSRWGIWLLEVLFVAAAVWLIFHILKGSSGRLTALAAGVILLSGLQSVLNDGNFTEEYAMPLQLACVAAFYAGMERPRRSTFFLAGCFAGLCFLLRPNIIVFPVSIAVFLLYEIVARKNTALAPMMWAVVLGGISTVAVTSAYFWLNGALAEMWDAMLRFNFIYTFARSGSRLSALWEGFSLLAVQLILGLLGWWVALRYLRQPEGEKNQAQRGLLAILVIALPLEILITGLPGRDYQHYFISWLPAISLLAGIFFACFLRKVPRQAWSVVAITSLLALHIVFGARDGLAAFWRARGIPPVDFASTPYQTALEYIYSHTEVDEKVLFWGNNLSLQWISGREAPTRFAYQSPLGVAGYVSPQMAADFLSELRANPPRLIIDTTINNDPLQGLASPLNEVPDVMRPIYEYIAENYSDVGTPYRTNWVVYERVR